MILTKQFFVFGLSVSHSNTFHSHLFIFLQFIACKISTFSDSGPTMVRIRAKLKLVKLDRDFSWHNFKIYMHKNMGFLDS